MPTCRLNRRLQVSAAGDPAKCRSFRSCGNRIGRTWLVYAAKAKSESAFKFKRPQFNVLVGPLLAYRTPPIPVETGTSPDRARGNYPWREPVRLACLQKLV